MIVKTLIMLTMILLSITILNVVVFAQIKPEKYVIEANRNCESASAEFDIFAQNTPTDKEIIIISYQGKKDTVNVVVTRRSRDAKKYLTEFYKGTGFSRLPDKVIAAIGVNQVEEGKLDFYVEGKLGLSMSFQRNRNFRLSPCYVDPDEYKNKLKSRR